jgi:hypothetical protein
MSRRLVRGVLTVKGYTIVEVETGEKGVRLAQERRPGLALASELDMRPLVATATSASANSPGARASVRRPENTSPSLRPCTARWR